MKGKVGEIRAGYEKTGNKAQLFTDFFQENWPISGNRTFKGEEKQARDMPVLPLKSCSIFSCLLLCTSWQLAWHWAILASPSLMHDRLSSYEKYYCLLEIFTTTHIILFRYWKSILKILENITNFDYTLWGEQERARFVQFDGIIASSQPQIRLLSQLE